MDQTRVLAELAALKDEVLERWEKEIETGQREMLTLEAELRQTWTANAEDAAVIKELVAQVSGTAELGGGNPGDLLNNSEANQRSRLELAKAKARDALRVPQLSEIQDSLQRLKAKQETPAKSIAALKNATMTDGKIVPLLPLTAGERQRHSSLMMALSDCELKTALGGTVAAVSRVAGEYCPAGEVIVTIAVGKEDKAGQPALR